MGPLTATAFWLGFEHRQMMTMMNYNYPYYHCCISAGFEKKRISFLVIRARIRFVWMSESTAFPNAPNSVDLKVKRLK
jgi:hypothetical protein